MWPRTILMTAPLGSKSSSVLCALCFNNINVWWNWLRELKNFSCHLYRACVFVFFICRVQSATRWTTSIFTNKVCSWMALICSLVGLKRLSKKANPESLKYWVIALQSQAINQFLLNKDWFTGIRGFHRLFSECKCDAQVENTPFS